METQRFLDEVETDNLCVQCAVVLVFKIFKDCHDGSKLKTLRCEESGGVEVDCWEGIQQREKYEHLG
jgi:hypothetical protein